MPPRKVRTDAKASDADAQFTSDEECREPSPVLMSGDTLTSFLTAFANTQAEANRQLVQSLMASHVAGGFPATPSPSPPSTSKSGNMSKCTARFDGQSRDPEAVEAFIDSVEMYKECASVNDDLALRGLPMLLIGEAAVWWRGIRNEVSSWSEAVQRLRSMYGTPCPAYKLYRKIFANEQNEELADSFIVCVRVSANRNDRRRRASAPPAWGRAPRASAAGTARRTGRPVLRERSSRARVHRFNQHVRRHWRSPLTAQADLRAIVESENFVPQITPYLLKLANTVSTAKETLERQQDVRKSYADKGRSPGPEYEEGDLVLMRTHVLSNAGKGVTSKFNPKRDGPYVVSKKVSPTTFLLAHAKTGEIFGKYHVSDLRPYHARESECPEPIVPKRNRGRPRKVA
ncbi:hypothetical protein SFRURICE_019913 [Spodoptera frugiperda]|nr:hypothetical protein SFRURICE_019913 [Spodoptera frugiperda]